MEKLKMGSYEPRKLNKTETATPAKEFVEISNKIKNIFQPRLKFDKNRKRIRRK